MSLSNLEFSVDERALGLLAERIALKAAVGDVVALVGDLGAGKTTFARFFIRALLQNLEAEVPSPTFSLLQPYPSARIPVAHADLYRLSDAEEADELGIDDLLADGLLLVEWPDRAPHLLGEDRLEIFLSAGADDMTRSVRVVGHGTWASRLARLRGLMSYLSGSTDWSEAHVDHLQGDASSRSYARLSRPGREGHGPMRAVLMDQPRHPDGPPIRGGLPYSRLVHLAEDVRPFVAVADALRAGGLSAPEIYAADLEAGFLILEDFGSRVFGQEMVSGTSQEVLWRAATDTLIALADLPAEAPMPLPDGSTHTLPPQDADVLVTETELLPDWYWPLANNGAAIDAAIRDAYVAHWRKMIAALPAGMQGWVLRDYHSPNLMWLPARDGAKNVGLLDFQDALFGSLAYDLVSLLQDARVDVPADLETTLLDYYCDRRAGTPDFDAAQFRFAYAVMGAQRNCKILGIFARLAKRDLKPHYLAHIPRIWAYLERSLAHPGVAGLRAWFDQYFPEDKRRSACQ